MWPLPKMSVDDILIYLRKSRTDDPALTVEEVLSKHEQMLDDWVVRNFPDAGRSIPESNRYREVVSGETLDSRPRVQELLRRAESPRVKAILIKEPQRLSRGDLEDIGHLVKLLRYSNTIVITLDYIYDLQDSRDRESFERELKRGNEFLEYQKRIMGAGRLLAVQNGWFIGQKAPYGYRKLVIREGKQKRHTLEPDPETAPVVKMIFEMYAAGTNSNQITVKLNSMGILTDTGKRWTVSGVKPILTNDHYIGMVHWNRRKTVMVVEDGEVFATRPRNHDFLVYPGRHQPIIDRELWDAVQAIKGTMPPVKSRARYVNPYAGLVVCRCGANMVRQQHIKDGIQRCAPRMVCVNQAQCHTASCTMDEFSENLIEAMEAAIADFTLKIESGEDSSAILNRKLIQQLEKRLEELDELEIAQWDKYTQEAMPRHIFDRLNKKLIREREETQEALRNAREAAPEAVDYAGIRETFYATLRALRSADATVKEQNQLLKQCIRKITYYRKQKETDNRRYGIPEPLELDIDFKI